ncbi:MAG: hypothetical protein R3F30_06585 [Planctomycetota bacterium]
MKPSPLPSLLLPLALAAPGLRAQKLCLAEGAQPGALTLVVRSEAGLGQNPVTLRQGLELLPIELCQRTAQQELRTDRPRRLLRQGLVRVELPGGRRLFRYRLSGGKQWGFLLVLADGDARILLELPGVGATGLEDPFTDRVGVGPDGLHALLATAAGALYLGRLDGQAWASTKAPTRPLTVTGVPEPLSLAVGTKVAWFVTDKPALYRVALADVAQPTDVSPPAVTAGEFKDQVALSGDGSKLCVLYGPKKQYHLYLLGEAGGATRLTSTAAKYEEPGYLPETVGGPKLLLNDDGSRLYYVDATVRDELYLVDTAKPTAPLQITADAHFQPYIGTGVLPIFALARLLVAIGDPQKLDWFAADAGAGTVTNLTGTGAATKPPFGTGQIDLANSMTVGNEGWILDRTTPGPVLHRVPLAGGKTSTVALSAAPSWGDALGVAPDLVLPRAAGDLLVDDAGALLLPLLPGLGYESPVRMAGLRSFEVRYLGVAFPCLLTDSGSLFVLPPVAEPFHSGLSPAGAWVAHGTTELLHLTAQGLQRLPRTTALRYVLSGAGF